MDKEESPAESNESDSEEAAVDKERALAEKEKVNTVGEALQNKQKRITRPKADYTFIFRVTRFSKMGSMTMPLSVTPEGWVLILTTLCSPQTEPPPSSDSKSKQRRLYGCCVAL